MGRPWPGGKETISVEAQEALKQQVAEFLSERSPVTVDGQPVKGTLDRIHFVRRSLRTTGVVDPPEDLDVNTATLGVIFVYPIDGLPQEASLTWDLFSPRIQNVPAAATDEAGGMPSTFRPKIRELRWQNFLTNPTVPVMMAVMSPQAPTISIPVISGLCFGLALAASTCWLSQGEDRKGNIRQGCRPRSSGGPRAGSTRASRTPVRRLPSPISRGPTLDSQQAKEVLACRCCTMCIEPLTTATKASCTTAWPEHLGRPADATSTSKFAAAWNSRTKAAHE